MHTIHSTPLLAAKRPLPGTLRKLLLTSAGAGALTLALAGACVATTSDAATASAVDALGSTGFLGAPSFAAVAAQVTPAVVNVAVTHGAGKAGAHPQIEIPGMPEGAPLNEFFRRFFENGSASPRSYGVPRQSSGQGSGFIIDRDGHIVTNDHVVEGAQEIQIILNDGSRYPAEIKGRDPKTDLAVLKIDSPEPLPYVEFGDSESARIGDWVLAVGNPFGLGGSVSAGIISARGRDIHSGPYDDYLQIDAPINRGNSGGPLFDSSGRVVGVNTAIYSPSGGNVGIGFAIPASTAESVIRQLREQGRIERGWLGVQIQSVTKDIAASLGLEAETGALVAAVLDGSPAAQYGLRAGDVILRVGDQSIDGVKTLTRLVAASDAGAKLSLQVRRNERTETVPVVIGRMPQQDPIPLASNADAEPAPPRLGLRLAPLTPEARTAHGLNDQVSGVLVVEVEADSPAEQAGIQPGSVISMVGQRDVTAPGELVAEVQEALARNRPSVLLLVEHKGEKLFVPVVLRA